MQGTPETRVFGTWGFALALMLPTWALMAACVPLIMRLARTYTFAPQTRARSAAIHVAAGLVFALIHNLVMTGLAWRDNSREIGARPNPHGDRG